MCHSAGITNASIHRFAVKKTAFGLPLPAAGRLETIDWDGGEKDEMVKKRKKKSAVCAAVLLLPPHSPSWLPPLCRMSDPVSAATPPS